MTELVDTELVDTGLVDTGLVDTGLVDTGLVDRLGLLTSNGDPGWRWRWDLAVFELSIGRGLFVGYQVEQMTGHLHPLEQLA